MIERLVQSLQTMVALEDDPALAATVDLRKLSLDYSDALLLATDCPQLQLAPRQLYLLRQVEQVLETQDLCCRDQTPLAALQRAAQAALAAIE